MKRHNPAGILLALVAGIAEAFIVPDTVDVRALPAGAQSGPMDLFVNSGTDSLVIDSISVSSAHIRGHMAELTFRVVRGTAPDLTTLKSFQIFFSAPHPGTQSAISPFPGTSRMVVPAGAPVKLDDVGFDFCFACPTAKRSAVAAQGDTLKARITFHAGAMQDSVLFLGIEKGTTGVLPISRINSESSTLEFFDLTGRRASPARIVPGTLPVPKR